MSTRSLEESCNLLNNGECLPDLKLCEEMEPIPSQQDLDDMFSISSGSPCPIKETKITTKDDHQAEVHLGQHLDKPGILSHLQHTSPLESIRELVEMEERSESRSPGDGAVRIKDACSSTAIRYVALPSEGCGNALERTALKQESTEVDSVDVFSSIDNIPAESCLPEDTSYMALVPVHQEQRSSSLSDHQKEVAGHQLASSHTSSDVLEVQLDNQSNITPPPDLQEESVGPAAGVTVYTISDELEAEKNNLGFKEVGDYISEKEDSVANQALIELQSARLLASRLHQKVLNLERQCHLKDKELHDMTVNLKKTSEALRTQNSEMAAVTEELHRLHLDVEAQKKAATASRTVNANGQLAANTHQRNGSSSVCTLV
ncbi:hypothetical protein Baya_13510 [Bagarius yarrelli]|uniref:Uncharacterized protein n=1 Tax=Bagarius yarrelli TaxID=175774 RepID=A0A556V5Y2_BAGYA|nr:hypothetical protein Baya_13510 [Bagarius yarrelli]